MKTYNFDRIIDRRNTNSLKYDYAKDFGYTNDHIPLWVADMDFSVIEEIKDAIYKINAVGVYGYTGISENYYKIVRDWMLKRYNFKVDKQWHCITPGVVYAMSTAINAFTQPNESVIVQTPVYSPFYRVVTNNKRNLIKNPLKYENETYSVDYTDFEQKIIDNNVKLFLLCNPHNPVGKVFTKEELIRLCHICCKHKVIIVSDEIHQDFVYEPNKHTVLANLNANFEQCCVVCTSPSKSFNIAGLKVSNIFIPNPELKKIFDEELIRRGPSSVNTLGIAACMAAYKYGSVWLDQLKDYLKGNIEFVEDYISQHMPRIKALKPQGTYLMWLDCSNMGLDNEQVNSFFKDEAKLWLNQGDVFRPEGQCFQRINIATSRSILQKAMDRIKTAYDVLYHDKSEFDLIKAESEILDIANE